MNSKRTDIRTAAIDRARRKVRHCREVLDAAIERHEMASRMLEEALEELQQFAGSEK